MFIISILQERYDPLTEDTQETKLFEDQTKTNKVRRLHKLSCAQVHEITSLVTECNNHEVQLTHNRNNQTLYSSENCNNSINTEIEIKGRELIPKLMRKTSGDLLSRIGLIPAIIKHKQVS